MVTGCQGVLLRIANTGSNGLQISLSGLVWPAVLRIGTTSFLHISVLSSKVGSGGQSRGCDMGPTRKGV